MTTERKLIGWVFRPEHEKHARLLLRMSTPLKTTATAKDGEISFQPYGSWAEQLAEANVLGIWCVPVYEKRVVEVESWINVYVSKNNGHVSLGTHFKTEQEAIAVALTYKNHVVKTIQIKETVVLPDPE